MIGEEPELSHVANRVLTQSAAAKGALVVGPIGSGVSSVLMVACDHLRNQGGHALHLGADGLDAVLGTDLPEALDRLERLAPTALVVDDVQLLTPSAAELLSAVALNAGVRVILGLHPGGDAGDRLHTLGTMGALHEFELSPLPPPLVGALSARLLDGRVHTGTVNELFRLTAGWPGLVTDVVQYTHTQGVLREASGMYRFVSDAGLPPATTRRLTALRRGWDDRLSEEFDRLALADGLTGRLADVSIALRSSGLVIEQGGMIQLATPIVAQAGVATTPSMRLARLADELLATAHNQDKPRQVRWQLAAGHVPPSEEIADAARAARAAGHVWEAVSLLALAGEVGDASTDTSLLRAELAQETGDWTLSATLYARLLADPALDPMRKGLVMAELATAKLWDLNEADEAVAVATTLREVTVGSPWAPTSDAVLGSILVYAGRVAEAMPLLEPVVSLPAHPSLISAASTTLVLSGRCAEGAEVADRAMAVRLTMPEQVGLPSLEVYANAQIMAYSELGELDRATEIAEWLTTEHASSGLRHGWLAIARSRVLLMRGEIDEARRAGDEAAVMFADLNRHATLRWAHAAQALTAAYKGDVSQAASALATLDRVGPSAVGFLEADVLRARAFHAAAAGELSAARSILQRAGAEAEALGNMVLAASAWHDLARVGGAAEAAVALTRVLPSVVSRWNAPRLQHAVCLAQQDVAGVLEAAAGFAAMGAKLHTLEAASQAHAVARTAGSRMLTQKAMAAVLEYSEYCPGARTPAMRDAATVHLTPREREVAELVAGGRTSRESAATLGVSVRTVENLLQRVYMKLGIQDRASLSDVIAGR